MKKTDASVIKFKLLKKGAKLPSYAHPGDAGFDIYAIASKKIKKGTHEIFPAGIASEISKGWFVSIRDRSGLAFKNGIHVLGGVVDSGYRGEWKIIVGNFGLTD